MCIQFSKAYSDTHLDNDAFLHAHASDTAVLNPISKVSQQNNIAQLTVVALVDYQHPGIWAPHYIPEFSKIRNQVEQMKKGFRRAL
jgi:hypothetical protein